MCILLTHQELGGACQAGALGAAHPPDNCTYCLLTSSPPYRLQHARLLASRHECVTEVTTKRIKRGAAPRPPKVCMHEQECPAAVAACPACSGHALFHPKHD